ncbi:hypothetical protein WJX72_002833 [[Myrmecia] bisecta]|uniref:Digalactosyldiacylglycerol synthase n=1 Tax=[Myrmecia] bisecta TaxID=41462 RepID=A0AAW1R580_9CHLO
MQAINSTFNSSLASSSRPLFPTPSLRTQAKQILGPDQAKSLEAAASQIMAAPKKTLQTCQRTLENCHENFQMLGTLLQHNLHTSLPVTQALTKAPASLAATDQHSAAPNTTFTTKSAVVAPISTQQQMVTAGRVLNMDSESQQRDLAAIEQALGEIHEAESSGQDHSHALDSEGRPLSFLQQLRKREKRRKKRSSLRDPGRQVAIVTTAALPWMTGTAVNPLLRAAYMAKDSDRKVTLLIPWLADADQRVVYPNNLTFETPEQQEDYVRKWVEKRTGFDCNFKVKFYPGRYAKEKMSILPVGDPTQYIPDSEADVAVLEEPEHLNWYHHGRRWTDKFNHVVGIIHTNYTDYARREEGGAIKSELLGQVNNLVTRVHCHKVVKLSDAVQPLSRQTTQFVHGVPQSFLAVGEKKAKAQPLPSGSRFERGVYFMGKAIWAKGYTELLDLVEKQVKRGQHIPIDCYGNGEDLEELKQTAVQRKLDLKFHGAKDHLDPTMHEYKVFINPSKSDVVATTTAEALAMGKWVIVLDHPSNQFFTGFSNCLTYKTPEEFSSKLSLALSTDPKPMSAEERRRLTWEDATERFLDVAEITEKDQPNRVEEAFDNLAWRTHNAFTGVEALRNAVGAGINTRDNPTSLEDFVPVEDSGGFFDRRANVVAPAQK